MKETIKDILAALDCFTPAGGCDECEAEERLSVVSDGVFRVLVVHEDECPRLARIEALLARRGERR